MTGPAIMWHMARSESDRAFARDVSTSASKKSDHVTSRIGVATRNSVLAKKCLLPCTAHAGALRSAAQQTLYVLNAS